MRTALFDFTACGNGVGTVVRHPREPIRSVRALRLVLVACVAATPSLSGCNRGVGGGATPAQPLGKLSACPAVTLLEPSESTIDFGVVPKAARREQEFWLTNPGGEPVDIGKIETTCDCLVIDLPTRVIPPSAKVAARAKLDLTHEDDFHGHLGIEVRGYTKSKALAFSLLVAVTVPREGHGDQRASESRKAVGK